MPSQGKKTRLVNGYTMKERIIARLMDKHNSLMRIGDRLKLEDREKAHCAAKARRYRNKWMRLLATMDISDSSAAPNENAVELTASENPSHSTADSISVEVPKALTSSTLPRGKLIETRTITNSFFSGGGSTKRRIYAFYGKDAQLVREYDKRREEQAGPFPGDPDYEEDDTDIFGDNDVAKDADSDTESTTTTHSQIEREIEEYQPEDELDYVFEKSVRIAMRKQKGKLKSEIPAHRKRYMPLVDTNGPVRALWHPRKPGQQEPCLLPSPIVHHEELQKVRNTRQLVYAGRMSPSRLENLEYPSTN